MNLEEAIKTAIEYETRIHDLYKEAVEKSSDLAGRRVFEALRKDEQHHVEYLKDRLDLWLEAKQLSVENLESIIPSKEKITKALKRLKTRMDRDDRKNEKQMLSKALKVEIETSNFYKKMVAEMDGPAQKMFARFLEIEDGHVAIVEAELDYISKTGFWFDSKEFDME